MKILHVELGRQLDGGGRQLAYLLNGLEKFPNDHVLVCVGGTEIAGAITNQSVKILRLKAAEEKGMKLSGSLRKIIRREKPHLLHIHGRPGDWPAALAGRREKIPMVYTRRVDTHANPIERFIRLPWFTRVIAPSRAIRQALLTAGVKPEKAIHIPCAVDTERFKPQAREREKFRAELGWRGDGPVLALAAQLVTHKGHGVFFGALPAVLAKQPNLRVLVFGRGPAGKELQKELDRRGLDKYVRFEGFRPDLENILPQVDLFIHPALVEGVGVVLAEAAACGVPIVASRIGGIPDIVKDRFNGYLVTPADRTSLARHIVELLDEHDHLLQFGKTGRELMVENFSIERLVNAHRELYRSVDQDG